jgi:hypothetical protein
MVDRRNASQCQTDKLAPMAAIAAVAEWQFCGKALECKQKVATDVAVVAVATARKVANVENVAVATARKVANVENVAVATA